MSAPKVIKRPKPKAAKPATVEKPATDKTTKAQRKPRKPAIERAVRAVELIEKKCDLLTKNVLRWRDEKPEVQEIRTTVTEIKARANDLGATMAGLLDAGFVPTVAGGGGRAPLSVDDDVVLREGRYEPEAHGENNYRVSGIRGRLFEIESKVEAGLKHFVPRTWLSRAGQVEDVSEGEEGGEMEDVGAGD